MNMWLNPADIAKAFDPNETRDERGRWTSGGSGGGRSIRETLAQHERVATDDAMRGTAAHKHGATVLNLPDGSQVITSVKSRTANSRGAARGKHLSTTYVYVPPGEQYGRSISRSKVEDLMETHGYVRKFEKAFDPNEARDALGKWTSSAGASDHPDKVDPESGYDLGDHYAEDGHQELQNGLDKIYEAADALRSHSDEGKDYEEDPPEDEDSKEWNDWDKQSDANRQGVADHLMELRQALADHAKLVTDKLADLDARIHAVGYGERVGKVFNPDQPRDTSGRWTTANSGSTFGKAVLSHLNPDQADTLSKTLEKLNEMPSDVSDHKDEMEEHAGDARDSEKDYHENVGPQDFKDLEPGEHFDAERDAITEHKENIANSAVDARDALEADIRNKIAVLNEYDGHLDEFNVANENEDPAAHPLEHLWEAKNADVEKNLTAGDVHATTALGNEGDRRRKARSFLSTIADVKGGGRIIDVSGMTAGAAVPVGKNARDILERAGIDVDGLDDEEVDRLLEQMARDNDVDGWLGKAGGTTLVHLIRHGATDMNNHSDDSQDRIRGWIDVPLNDDGRKDAEKAAKKAGKAGIKVLVSSDLSRAKETADIIGKAIGVTPITTPKLRPWDLGKFAGTPSKEAFPKILPYVTDKQDDPVPGGESFNDFRDRAMQGLKLAVDKAAGKPVGVVTHYRNLRLYGAWDEAGQPADHSIDEKEFGKKGGPPGELVEMEVNTGRLAGGQAKDVAKAALDGDMGAMLELLAKQGNGDTLNASLQLQPLNSEWAKSPFPWDQNAMACMKPEETKPFLGALTDPDNLPVKTVRLNNVVALQDRVDPERVQYFVQNEAGADLPVVVRLNGRKIIVDGHHRMAARWLRGRKTAQVHYIDLNPQNADTEAIEEERLSTSDVGKVLGNADG